MLSVCLDLLDWVSAGDRAFLKDYAKWEFKIIRSVR